MKLKNLRNSSTVLRKMILHEEYDEVGWQQLLLLPFQHGHQRVQNKYKASMLQDSYVLEMMASFLGLV